MDLDLLCLSHPSILYQNNGSSSFTNCPTNNCGLPLYPGVVENREGWLMGMYKIECLIAVGGQARVYSAVRRNLENQLDRQEMKAAIKALRLDNPDFANNAIELRKAIDLFNTEAELLTNKLSHDGIVKVFGYQSFNDGRAFTAMELVEGDTLEKTAEYRKLSYQELIIYAVQLCDILEYVHSQKDTLGRPLVYRDLSPDNVMVQPKGKIKLLDFGIARHSANKTRTGMGKKGYSPPEQYKGKEEPRSDQYSLAVIIHELITQKDPEFPGQFELLRQLKPDAPEHLEITVARALSLKPEQRYDSMKDFKNAITNLNSVIVVSAQGSASGSNNPSQSSNSSQGSAQNPSNQNVQTPLPIWTPTKQGVSYEIVRLSKSYAETQELFRKECKKDSNNVQPQVTLPSGTVFRQNTFLENIIARLDDFFTLNNPDGSQRSLDDRKRRFLTPLDSCTGIAYEKNTANARIIPISLELLRLPENFNQASLKVNFSSLNGIYVRTDMSSQELWEAALEGRKDVYNTYHQLIQHLLQRNNVMNFWTVSNPQKDQLRALCVGNLNSNSDANGNNLLDDNARFLRVAQVKKFP